MGRWSCEELEQPTSKVATSSGEAKYYAIVKAASEALGIEALARDLGWKAKIQILVDSSAARAIASRTGLGKTRHIEVRPLWIQEAVAQGRFEIKKVKGVDNPADVLTKPLSQLAICKLLAQCGVKFGWPLEQEPEASGGVGPMSINADVPKRSPRP